MNKSYPEQVSRLLEVTGYLAGFDCEMSESVRFRAVAETLDRDMNLGSAERTTKVVHDLADPRLDPISEVLRGMIVELGRENAKKGMLAYPGGDVSAEPKDPTKSASLWSELRKPTALNLNPVLEATRTLSKLAGQIWGEGSGPAECEPPGGMAAALCEAPPAGRKCRASYQVLQALNCDLDRMFKARKGRPKNSP